MASEGGGNIDEGLKLTYQVVEKSWLALDSMWKEIGYEPQSIHKRKNIVYKHVQELLTEMVDEEGSRVTEKKQLLENLIQEIIQLAKELTLDDSVAEKAKTQAQGKTLLQAEHLFEDIAKELRKRKEIRMAKYHKVNDMVISISDELGEEPFKIEFDGIPSDAQVASLEQKLSHLQKEKHCRQGRFKKLQKTIISLFECEDLIPRNELERVISSDEVPQPDCPIKILSVKILFEMEELESSLRNEIKANLEEGERLWQKIRELWSRLTIDEEIQLAFEKVHRGVQHTVGDKNETIYKPRVIRGLQSELTRLEEEKRRNMSLFIQQVREELADIWTNKCFIDKVETRFHHSNYQSVTDFEEADYFSDLYTEELLEKHEREGTHWRQFVERNKKIIDGVNKRSQMFNQYKILEIKSDDPARLANRGGALLKEEKERKMLEKAIPRLETELKNLSQQFEESFDGGHGMRKFLVYGNDIPEMIESDWAFFHEEKERRKDARKGPATAGKTMMTTQLGNPGSRKRPATPTSTQRVGLTTPNKRNKLAPATPSKLFSNTPVHSTPFAQSPCTLKKVGGSTVKANAGDSTQIRSKPPRGATAKDRENFDKKYFVNSPKPKGKTMQNSMHSAARKLVRKSIGKSRIKAPAYTIKGKGNSLASSTSSMYASSVSNNSVMRNQQQASYFDMNPTLEIDSLDKLNFSQVTERQRQTSQRRNVNVVFSMVEPPSFQEEHEFVRPATRSRKQTPATGSSTAGKRQQYGSKIPSTIRGKEQIDPTGNQKVDILSPVSTYTEFTDHLLCTSTLNSSTVSTVVSNRKPLSVMPSSGATTPTKSEKAGGFAFTTPAKKAFEGDEYF